MIKRTWTPLAIGLLLAGSAWAQPCGMGPGMMGGAGGYGPGPGMMGGHGTYGHGMGQGMGPSMMWGGYGGNALAGLDLRTDQRQEIAKVEEDVAKSHWQLMGAMHEQDFRMAGGFGPGVLDVAAARKSFDARQATQKAMFELTLAQREQLRRDWTAR